MAKISGNKHGSEVAQSGNVLSKKQRRTIEAAPQMASFSFGFARSATDCGDYIVKFIDATGNVFFEVKKKRLIGKSLYFERTFSYLVPNHEKEEFLYESIYHPLLISALVRGILYEKLVDLPYFLREEFPFMLDAFDCGDLKSRLDFLTHTRMWNGPTVTLINRNRISATWGMPLEFYSRVRSLIEPNYSLLQPGEDFSAPEEKDDHRVVVLGSSRNFHGILHVFLKEIFYFTYHGKIDNPHVVYTLIRTITQETVLALDALGFRGYLDFLKRTIISRTIISSVFPAGETIDRIRGMVESENPRDFMCWWTRLIRAGWPLYRKKMPCEWNGNWGPVDSAQTDADFIMSASVENDREIPSFYQNGFVAMVDWSFEFVLRISHDVRIRSRIINLGKTLTRYQPDSTRNLPLPDFRTGFDWDSQFFTTANPYLRFFMRGGILDVPLAYESYDGILRQMDEIFSVYQ